MEVQCCKCSKIRDERGWRWTDEFADNRVSYSYCPECLEEFRCEAGLARAMRPRVTVLATACA
jgi:hypothetical protein